MPRFYFDVIDSRGFYKDDFGEDLSGFEEAREQALGLLPDLIRYDMPVGDLHVITCKVRDDADRVVYQGEIICRGTRDPS